MATIKSYTTIEQSRKLAEILPIESADMCYLPTHIGDEHHFIASLSPYSICTKMTEVSIKYCIPCWSLASLFGALPKIINNETLFIETSAALWHIGYRNIYTARADNPIDACVAMFEKLHELKML